MTAPSLAQLRVLVDRAERGRLTATEARVLRAGIEALVTAAESSERFSAGRSDRNSPEKAPGRLSDGRTPLARPAPSSGL